MTFNLEVYTQWEHKRRDIYFAGFTSQSPTFIESLDQKLQCTMVNLCSRLDRYVHYFMSNTLLKTVLAPLKMHSIPPFHLFDDSFLLY